MLRGQKTLRLVLPYREWINMRASSRIARKFAVPGFGDSIVLFSWSANPEPLQRNVARVDCDGKVIWRAELPSTAASDCFVNLACAGDGYVVQTYSGWKIRLDVNGAYEAAERERAVA